MKEKVELELDRDNLMFPPVLTKDTKAADWMEIPSGSFEPFKYYVQSKSRQISLEFQWVTGGKFTPTFIHNITSSINISNNNIFIVCCKNEFVK